MRTANKKRMKKSAILLVFVFISFSIFGQNQILLDEDFSDWNSVQTFVNDTNNDGASGGLDIDSIWVTNDEDFLFIKIRTTTEFNIQNDNELSVFIDTDQNSTTGRNIKGIGAEISYNFGDRDGRVNDGSNTYIDHEDIGLVTLPTVTSNQFEIAILRETMWYDMDNGINIVIQDDRTNGDRVPNTGSYSYQVDNSIVNDYPAYSLNTPTGTDIRILSYNVENDGLVSGSTATPMRKIIKAMNPDILAFQELYDANSATVSNIVNDIFPNKTWYSKKVNPDIILVSSYPIVDSGIIGGNGAFKLLVGDRELLVINCHLRCCDLDAERQVEVDRIIEFIRESKQGMTSVDITEDTPIIVLGDMNFVGNNDQVYTLLTGDIDDESEYGADHLPDWDDSFMEDAKPFVTGLPMVSTWYKYTSSFSPGRLDYIVYSGSVIDLKNTFTLFTPALSSTELQSLGLSSNDVFNASDHLPLIADFSFDLSSDTDDQYVLEGDLNLYPNPASDYLEIDFQPLNKIEEFKVRIFSSDGAYIRNVSFNQSDNFRKRIDLSKMYSGSYFLEIRSKEKRVVKYFAVVK